VSKVTKGRQLYATVEHEVVDKLKCLKVDWMGFQVMMEETEAEARIAKFADFSALG